MKIRYLKSFGRLEKSTRKETDVYLIFVNTCKAKKK